MYHSGRNPLGRIRRNTDARSRPLFIPRRKKQRDLHKAFLRYHDPANWPLLRDALKAMGRSDLIGNRPEHLVPAPGKGTPDRFQRGRPEAARPAVRRHRSSRKRSR
ncbi:MAG: DUF3362 domain-containing protein, partial [Gammaproteobacteria bacterium]|nr:DUF3362 domain-containing protein [Gammaproteobacteria bacterium]